MGAATVLAGEAVAGVRRVVTPPHERRPIAWNMSTGEQGLVEIPAAAGSSSSAGWSGALDTLPEEVARIAEESRAAVEAAAPRAE